MGEYMANVPLQMAYILLRILVGFYLVACYHLYIGINLEFNAIDASENGNEDTGLYKNENQNLRAARILCTLFLIIWVLFMTFVLFHLCYISGLDGSRVLRPKAFKYFRKYIYGNLIFQ